METERESGEKSKLITFLYAHNNDDEAHISRGSSYRVGLALHFYQN